MTALLELEDLRLSLPLRRDNRALLHGVSFTLQAGEAIGLVGESGSGKTMTARAITRLLPPGARVSGDIRFDGRSVLGLDRAALRQLRRRDVGMIFQDPRAHINPVRTIGDFLGEALVASGVDRREGRQRAVRVLGDVGVSTPERRLSQYPHQLSGGLLQRVMIASVLLAEPRLVLADEPTTALDVTTQSDVMAILSQERERRGQAMVFITHDLDLAAAVCDRIAVLYAGSIMEQLAASALHERAAHPYTRALMGSRPDISVRLDRLPAVVGQPLSGFDVAAGCAFAGRCPCAVERCHREIPLLRPFREASVACHRVEELADDRAAQVEEPVL